MKRLILAAALTLGLALPVMAQGSQQTYFWESVTLTISSPSGPDSHEVMQPKLVYFASDGSWAIEDLKWQGWGSDVARATGTSSASNGIPNIAEGKRIRTPAVLTLTNPGRFHGHRVYRCYKLVLPARHESDQSRCLKTSHGYTYFS